MNKKFNSVYEYYNDDNIIDNILNPDFFGKNLWHTPLLLTHESNIVNENEFMIINSNVKNNDTILDFGCGVGGFLRIIMDKYKCKAYGVNISPKQIELAEKNFNKKENVEFIFSWGMSYLENNSIDVIFAQESIVHCKDKEKLFNGLYRILKPNGVLIFLDWFLYNKELAIKTDIEYKTFIESLDTYKELLNKTGFKNINIYDPINTDELDRVRNEKGFTNYIIKCKK